MKPVIGVLPLWDEKKESYWMLPGYMEGIKAAGGLPIMLPMTVDEAELEQLSSLCQGFLFTGGHDVDPELYGEKPIPDMVEICTARDHMEVKLLQIAIGKDIPVLGICRGIQMINVALGGTLYQDLPIQRPTDTDHHMAPPYDRVAHHVKICRYSPLFALLQTEKLGVNSYHHQAIKDLSPQLTLMATADDGLVEAVYMPGKRFLWALQWHPEFSYQTNDSSRRIFCAFVQSCR